MTTNIALIVFEAGFTFQNWQIAKYLSTDIAHSVNTETETDVVWKIKMLKLITWLSEELHLMLNYNGNYMVDIINLAS